MTHEEFMAAIDKATDALKQPTPNLPDVYVHSRRFLEAVGFLPPLTGVRRVIVGQPEWHPTLSREIL